MISATWRLRWLAIGPRSLSADRLGKMEPGNLASQRDLLVSHNKIGDARLALGDLAAALRRAMMPRSLLLTAWPRQDPEMPCGSATSRSAHNKIGDLRRARGELAAALASYRASHEIFERLAAGRTPTAPSGHRDLSVSSGQDRRCAVARRDLAAALTSLASLSIRDRLATANPGNVVSLRDAVRHARQDRRRAGQHVQTCGGAASYQASLAIAARLARGDPRTHAAARSLGVLTTRSATCSARGATHGGADELSGGPRDRRLSGRGRLKDPRRTTRSVRLARRRSVTCAARWAMRRRR